MDSLKLGGSKRLKQLMRITIKDSATGFIRFFDMSMQDFSSWVYFVWKISETDSLEKKIAAAKSGGWTVIFS